MMPNSVRGNKLIQISACKFDEEEKSDLAAWKNKNSVSFLFPPQLRWEKQAAIPKNK